MNIEEQVVPAMSEEGEEEEDAMGHQPMSLSLPQPPPHAINPFREDGGVFPLINLLPRRNDTVCETRALQHRLSQLTTTNAALKNHHKTTTMFPTQLEQVSEYLMASLKLIDSALFLKIPPPSVPSVRIDDAASSSEQRELLNYFIGNGGVSTFSQALQCVQLYRASTASIAPQMQKEVDRADDIFSALHKKSARYHEALAVLKESTTELVNAIDDARDRLQVARGNLEHLTDGFLGHTSDRLWSSAKQNPAFRNRMRDSSVKTRNAFNRPIAANAEGENPNECLICLQALHLRVAFECSGVAKHHICPNCTLKLTVEAAKKKQREVDMFRSGTWCAESFLDLKDVGTVCPFCTDKLLIFSPDCLFRFDKTPKVKKAEAAKRAASARKRRAAKKVKKRKREVAEEEEEGVEEEEEEGERRPRKRAK